MVPVTTDRASGATSSRLQRDADRARVRELTAAEFLAALDTLVDIYLSAMGYPESHAAGRRQLWAEHARRAGFSCVIIVEQEPGDPHHQVESVGRGFSKPTIIGFGDATIIGFAYGYQGARGQWWNSEVTRGVDGTPGQEWLVDYAELTELHVRPDRQGRGLGERALRAYLAQRQESTVLLSTPEGENRAWRLYRRLGFVDVLRHFQFTGDPRPFGVLGLRMVHRSP